MGDVRCPASQPVHSDEAAGATCPGGQTLQRVPFTARIPDAQTRQRSWSEVAIEPGSHGVHDEDAAGATSPGAHAWHFVPLRRTKDPAGHISHLACSESGAKPASQTAQAALQLVSA